MSQSRGRSALEAIVNNVVGYVVAVVAQMVLYPLFGIHTSMSANLGLGACFTVVSFARSYLLRRAFNFLESK